MFFREPEGSPSKIAVLKFYYLKYLGIKSDDTAFLGEYVIILYLLWHEATSNTTNLIVHTNSMELQLQEEI